MPTEVCCQPIVTLEDLPSELASMLSYVRHHIAKDVNLYFRVCRLLKACLKSLPDKDKADSTRGSTSRIITTSLLPALQCIGFKPASSPDKWEVNTNPAAAFVLWEAVELFPYSERYSMYEVWKGEGLGKEFIGTKHIDLVRAEVTLLTEVRGRLKRLSKENTRLIGRHLAKSVHSNPIVVAAFILSQIESFDNLIQPIVDSLRYANPLALDVLAWSILKQLTGSRPKLQPDGTHHEKWLSSVATFTGTFFRKFPQTDISGLLVFLVSKLAQGECLDLLVLKELLNKMGGCETTMIMDEDALENLSGGPTLRAEGLNLTEKDNASKKAVKMLRLAMNRDGIALRFLVLLSKISSSVLFTLDTKHIKLMAHLCDICQEVLMLFVEFITTPTPSVGKPKEKSVQDKEIVTNLLKLLPSFYELKVIMRMEFPVLFTVARPLLRAALIENEVRMNYFFVYVWSTVRRVMAKASCETAQDPKLVKGNLAVWHPLSETVLETVRQSLPGDCWQYCSPELYVMFWSLSLYDIHFPKERYDSQITRIKANISRLEQQR
jgi:THO complex subunit 2